MHQELLVIYKIRWFYMVENLVKLIAHLERRWFGEKHYCS
jgi:hypothetical protein